MRSTQMAYLRFSVSWIHGKGGIDSGGFYPHPYGPSEATFWMKGTVSYMLSMYYCLLSSWETSLLRFCWILKAGSFAKNDMNDTNDMKETKEKKKQKKWKKKHLSTGLLKLLTPKTLGFLVEQPSLFELVSQQHLDAPEKWNPDLTPGRKKNVNVSNIC